MRCASRSACVVVLLFSAAVGCKNAGQQQQVTQMQQQYAAQLTELQRRASSLDANNVDLHQQLARSEQHLRVVQQDLEMTRSQLASTNQQLALAEAAKQQAGERIAMLETSAMRQGGATITANSSLRREIEALNIPGLNVRHESDVIRIELPADQLFQPRTANLYPNAYAMIDKVAVAMKDRYPSERITIEGHTDSDVVVGQWGNNDQLTAAQANAVFQILTVRHQMSPGRFQVLGKGSGQPIVSNGTPEGKARNRRVELVVHTGS